MTDNVKLHVVFSTGPVGLAVMDELVSKSKRVRMVNRSGRASVPHGVEVVGGDATDEAFAREASEGASVVYFSLNPPYNKWPELFPPLQAGVLEGAASAGLLRAARTSVCCRRASLWSGCARQERPASRGPRPTPHLHLRARHRQRVGDLGRMRRGSGAGVAPTQPRDAHNAPVRGDDLRGSRQACTRPSGTEDRA